MLNIARKYTPKGQRMAEFGLIGLLFALALVMVPLVKGAYSPISDSNSVVNAGAESLAYTAVPEDVNFSAAFLPDTIGPGSVSTLQFTIDNTSPDGTVSDLAFTNTLPAGVTIADPANVWATCDAVITAPDGGSTIEFSGARLGYGRFCTITVDVTSSTPGTHNNVSGTLTSSVGSSGTASADVTVDTDSPGFSKSFSPASVKYGDRSTLTFTIDNTANANDVYNLSFTDEFPLGMVIADPANASTTCGTTTSPPKLTAVPGKAVISFYSYGDPFFPALGAGATCTVTVDVMGNAVGQLDNNTGNLTASSNYFYAMDLSGKASAALEVTADHISLVKTFTDDPAAPGGLATLEFTIRNLDRVNAMANITFTDDLYAALSGLTAVGLPLSNPCGNGSQITGTSLLTLSGGNLPAEGTCTFSVPLQIPPAAVPGTYLNSTSSITADIGDHTVTGGPATAPLFVQPIPLLTKEFVDDPVGAGGTAALSFTITNVSTTSAATDVAFIDELTTFLPFPVSATLPSTPCGPGSAIFLVLLDDDRQGLSLTGGSLDPGASCTFDVDIDMPVDMPSGTYTNTTEMVTAVIDGVTYSGKPASDDLVIVGAPRLFKRFTNDPVLPGEVVTLEFTINNRGDSENAGAAAAGLAFTDDLNAALSGLTAVGLPLNDVCGTGSQISGLTELNFTGGTLAPGSSCTFALDLQLPESALSGRYTNFTSGLTGTVGEIPVTGSPAQDDLLVGGLSLTKSFTDDPVIPGDTVTLEYIIDNTGAAATTDMSFNDIFGGVLAGLAAVGLPETDVCGAGSQISGSNSLNFSGGNLAAGESCTFSVTLQVPGGAASNAYNSVTSALSANVGGSWVALDPAKDVLTITDDWLLLSKSFPDGSVLPGETTTVDFTVTNYHDSESVTDITFTDDLAAALPGLTAVSLPAADICGSGSQIAGTDLLTLTGGSLPPGGTCAFQVTLAVPDGAAIGRYYNTTSQATGTIGGLPVTGGPATAVLDINALTFTQAFQGPAAASGLVTLTFTIQNHNPTAGMRQIAFTDDLDAVIPGLTANGLPQNDVCGRGSQLSGSSFLTLIGASLGPDESCTFDVTLQIPPTAASGMYENVTSDLKSGGLKAGEPAAATLTVEPPPTFQKSFAPRSIIEGNTSTLMFVIDNTASALAATNLDFVDNFPVGMTVANPPNASTTCTGGTLTAAAGTGVISYGGGMVGAGSVCTVHVAVTSNIVGTHVNTTGNLTSSSGNSGTASDTLTVNAKLAIYLPLVLNNALFAPDLVVTALNVSYGNIEVAIENQGNTAVSDEFWVDVYIDPQTPPTMVNQVWPDLADEGLVWGVSADALPLQPGAVLTLTMGDSYYMADLSEFAGEILPGTAVYAQVDSVDTNTTYGAVLERDEISGDPYNNVYSVIVPVSETITNWINQSVVLGTRYQLPIRP